VKRVKDILRRINGTFLWEIIGRRKDYYHGKWRSRYQRRKTIDHYLNSTRQPKLHLGCGDHLLQGWLNSDILGIQDGMVFIDVREELPFEKNSLDFIFSEHLLEHLTYEEGVYLIEECSRTLKSGGVLRLSTPDLAFLIDLCVGNDPENREYIDWAFDIYWPGRKKSKALTLNYYLTSWGHKCIYDHHLLRATFQQAGFRDVRKANVGESDSPELRGLEGHGRAITQRWNRKESLVVEATKP
jgi:predicted SAM-dependent methyltransferase